MNNPAGIPVVEPDTPEALARALASAATGGRRLELRGGGTKAWWGRVEQRADAVLSTRGLARVLAHAESDLTVTCEAGVTLAALNRQLAQQGQWLPLDSAFDAATIGGIIATNDSGPLRHRYGAPRDLLIGVRLATTDGRLVRAGGTVVKNVAGYDLGKLVAGSFGTLAAIVSATFKLTPLPAAFGTLRFTFFDRVAATEAAAALAASQLDPLALDLRFEASGIPERIEVLVRFGSTAAAVELQIAGTERLVRPFTPRSAQRVVDAAEEAVWRAHTRRPWTDDGVVIRVSWLPAALPSVVTLVADMRRSLAAAELTGRVGLGAGLLRCDGDTRALVSAVQRVRGRSDVFNDASVLRAPVEVLSQVDVWGARRTLAPVYAAVRRAFDPAGVLSAGQGPS